MAMEFNEEEVRRAIAVIKPEGRLFEVRLIKDRWNAAGYFTDADKLVAALRSFPARQGANAYIVLNRINPACYSREAHDRFVEGMKPTVSDGDIIGYDWLMIDIDPVRPAGTSSTAEQVKKSQVVAGKIFHFLKDRGWRDPVVAMSGNGTHLLYSISLENTPERKTLVQNCLQALDMLFSDGEMDIDLTTFNPARICKLYGTVARKGAHTAERPHRLASILRQPDPIEVTPSAYLEALADMLPKPEQPQKYNHYNPGKFDLQEWIDRHGISVTEKSSWAGGTKWVLECCPFNPQHGNKDASIIQTSDGKICFNCFHKSCADKKWREFRQHYEPDAYQRTEEQIPNYLAEHPIQMTSLRQDDNLAADIGPVFMTTEYIRQKPTSEESFILTGISGIDQRMRGLKRGFVSVLSGLRSAGKSSILSQIVVRCRDQGFKCALFSGEMNDKQVLKWLTLQAAGRNYVLPTQWENIFYPNDYAKETVSKWLDEFVYIYNNDYGNDFPELLKRLEQVVTEKQLDMVLIDNLMALNISDLDSNVYMQQRNFVLSLKRMAVRLNIHVLFVAHPRKADGYLRTDDISGSGDLSNAVDNVFIIHRVDEDFRNLTQQYFRWKQDNPLYKADNVIEICKDRDNGYRDIYVPLWFERETKRLKNTESENYAYGWDHGMTPVEIDLPFLKGGD